MYVCSELVDGAREFLVDKGYFESTIRHHDVTWSRLSERYAEHAPDGYDSEVKQGYPEQAGLADGPLTRFHQSEGRSVVRLTKIAKEVMVCRAAPKRLNCRLESTTGKSFRAY